MDRNESADVDAFSRQVAGYLAREELLLPGERPVVGFSGGADSTALLLLLQRLGLGPRAVHLHHGLRGEAADADEAWCRAFCEARGIAYATDRLDPTADPQGEGLEAALRRQRLDWWRAHLAPDEVVALGHHGDDALETLLMHLLRGANASGLTALRGRRQIAGVTLVRPLLAVDRAAITDWLRGQGVTDWREDATNREPGFLRNRVRHELLPLLRELGHGDAGLRLSREHLAADAAALEDWVASIPLPDGALAEATLLATPPPLWPRLLRRLGGLAGTDLPPRRAAVERLRDWLRQQPADSGQMDLDGDFILERRDGQLRVRARPNASAPALDPQVWDWRQEPVLPLPGLGLSLRVETPGPAQPPADADIALWPLIALPCPLTVRLRRPGDRFVPFGMDRSVRVKKVLGASTLSPAARARQLVVAAPDGRILWLPGLRRAADLPLSDESEATVALIFESDTLL